MIGTSLGPYKIIELLGAGGMGEVYLGEDTRLGRKVAIKVLPEEYASDPERLARFEQEARAAAALNHPHIAVVHDIGTEGDTHFMVQEYLEGQSLRERLDKGALPLDKALDLSIEVGEALIAAHKAGIIHRDLKPDNIFVTQEGHAKVLDFGLAKLVEATAPTGTDLSMSPTMVGTVAGQIMGTAGYMAPEQIKGEDVDHRVDVFAFGCVLYATVTGQEAFVGKNVHDTLGRILSEEPRPLSDVNRRAPAELEWIRTKCLAKEASDRYQDTRDLVIDLRMLASTIGSGAAQYTPESTVASNAMRRYRVPWALGALGALVTVAATWLAVLVVNSTGPPADVVRFSIPSRAPSGRHPSFSVSQDGTLLALIGVEEQAGLWIRPFASETAYPVDRTEGAEYPFWAPDGSSIAFFQEGELLEVDLATLARRKIADAPNGRGGTWNDDDVIVFAPEGNGALYRVSAAGGEVTPVTVIDSSQGEESHRFPHFLPDGRRFTFFVMGTNQVYVGSVESNDRTQLVNSDSEAYPIAGYLLFLAKGTLMAQPFDEIQGQVIGEAVPWMTGFRGGSPVGHVYVSATANGVLAFRRRDLRDSELVWFDRSGNRLEVVGDTGGYGEIALSPNETLVAFPRDGGIWLLDLARGGVSQVTRYGTDPAWSPDATQLAFRAGNSIYQKGPGAAVSERDLVFDNGSIVGKPQWIEGGRSLLFQSWNPTSGYDLWSFSFDDQDRTSLVVESADQRDPQLSPDHAWIAYVTDQFGQNEVYATSYPDLDQNERISFAGGIDPRWRRDGKELFYFSPSGSLMAVDVGDGGFGPPRELFDELSEPTSYAISGDGQRFLVVVPRGPDTSSQINVVLNWFEELKERVSTGGR